MGHRRAESVSQAGRVTGRTDKSFERAVVGLSSVFFLSVCLSVFLSFSHERGNLLGDCCGPLSVCLSA